MFTPHKYIASSELWRASKPCSALCLIAVYNTTIAAVMERTYSFMAIAVCSLSQSIYRLHMGASPHWMLSPHS